MEWKWWPKYSHFDFTLYASTVGEPRVGSKSDGLLE
jgi:hypothetical protein